jgi:ATP-dependent Lon protease
MPLTKNEKIKQNSRAQKKNQLKRRGSNGSDDEEDNIIIRKGDSDDGSDDSEDGFETCSDSEEEEEDSDSTYVPSKKSKNSKKPNKKRIVEDTEDEEEEIEDTEDEDETEDDEDTDDEEDDESSAVDPRELPKTIAALFPSNYINKKVRDDEAETKKTVRSSKKDTKDKKSKPEKKRPKRGSKRSKTQDEEIDDDSDEDDEDYAEEDEDAANKFSIFFTAMNGGGDPEDETAICDDADAKDDCDSEDEKTFMKETYETILLPSKLQNSFQKSILSGNDKDSKKKSKKNSKHSKGSKKSANHDDEEEDPSNPSSVETEYNELIELKKHLLEKLAHKPKSTILLNAIEECRVSIKKLVKKSRMKNTKKYYKLVNKDEKQTSEIDYFKKKLSHKEQIRAMKELKEINDRIHIEKPYRLMLLESNIPAKYKATVMQKLNVLRSMEPGDPEYYKLKTWVDTFMRVPFNTHKSLSITLNDGVDKCSEFMENAMATLDTCVYGLRDAKMQIMQMLGQWITNPDAMGSAIAIKGPPGTGKTSLVKEGISKILGREFTFIALGGTGDASFLEGHSYTYEGSMWGKIVQILIDSKCMNPVIYFDELDKVSDTPRGEEIIGILTHLTDTTQNSQFHDKYFSEVDFDLSKCLFIFSYNDESKVNPILRDRMYRIETKGYDAKEKGIIARNYLLPKIREQVSFTDEEIIIPDDTLQMIISNKGMTKEEDGVRNLKRCLEIIHTKLNLFRLMKPEKNLFVKDMDVAVSFPFTVRSKDAELLIKSEQHQNQSLLAMYC